MYAIVRTGGKQFKVWEKAVITVEKLEAEAGDILELTDVLLVSNEGQLTVGAPNVAGAKVTVRVLSTAKGKKIHGYTYKPTKGVQRHYGHRQWQTQLIVTGIQGAQG